MARLGGDFVLTELGTMAPRFGSLPARGAVAFDLSRLSRFDTAGAWLLATTLRRTGGTLVHASPAQRSLLETVTGALPAEVHDRPKRRPVHVIEDLGRATAAGLRGLIDITGFFGLVVARRPERHARNAARPSSPSSGVASRAHAAVRRAGARFSRSSACAPRLGRAACAQSIGPSTTYGCASARKRRFMRLRTTALPIFLEQV